MFLCVSLFQLEACWDRDKLACDDDINSFFHLLERCVAIESQIASRFYCDFRVKQRDENLFSH